MTNKACDALADQLVDYADGELSAAETEAVAAHLAHCPACQATLQRLERSLNLARAVWQQAADGDHARQQSMPIRPAARRFRTLAACVAILLLATGIFFVRRDREPEIKATALETAVEPADDIDFEALLAREAQAARLAASAELLASHSATLPYEQDALAYLASAYPDTEPGRRAARGANPSTEQSP
jgi:predicted anti-sigma-YlaC factor YlaD